MSLYKLVGWFVVLLAIPAMMVRGNVGGEPTTPLDGYTVIDEVRDTVYAFDSDTAQWSTCTQGRGCFSNSATWEPAFGGDAITNGLFTEQVLNPNTPLNNNPDQFTMGFTEQAADGSIEFTEFGGEEDDSPDDATPPDEGGEPAGTLPGPVPPAPPDVLPVDSSPATAAGASPPGTSQLPGVDGDAFAQPPGRPSDPIQAYLQTLGAVTRTGPGRYTVNGQQVTVRNNLITFPDGSVVEVSPFTEGGFTTTRRVGDTVLEFQQYRITGQPNGAPQQFDPALGVTEIGVTASGDIVIRNQIGNVRGEYVQADANTWTRTDGTGEMIIDNGMAMLTFNNDADAEIDEYVIAVGNEVYRGDSYTAEGGLMSGDRPLLRRTETGFETDFRQVNNEWQPQTIARTEGGQFITYSRTYDNEGNIVSSTGRDASGKVIAMYTGEETGEPTVRYHYNDRGELDGIMDSELCPGMTCTFDEYNQRRKAACDADPQSAACQHANEVVDPFRAGFWQRWDAMRRGAAAGQGYCGMLDMLSVSCGDSLFPAFDDFMQNTVIGNVLSGETSALCTLWTDNPENGGSVALGPGGFASAWIAAEYVSITEPEEENGTLTGETTQQYATKITFDIRPSGIVDGECKEQMIEARVVLDGQLVDIDFDGFTNDNDFIRLQCDKGGFSATGSRAIVRYVETEPNEICLLLNGDFNSFFELSLDDGKLCNRVVPLERTGIDFSCSFCIFGDSGFVEGEVMQPSEVPVLNGPPAEEETGPVENRPEVGNPE